MNREKYFIMMHNNTIYKKLLTAMSLIFCALYQNSTYADLSFPPGQVPIFVHQSINPGLPDGSYNQSYVVTSNQQYAHSPHNNQFIAATFSNSADDTYLCIGQKPLNEITTLNNVGFVHFDYRINHIDWGAETLIPSPFANKSFIALSLNDGNNNVDFYEFNYTTSTLTLLATQAIGSAITSLSWSNSPNNKLLVTHEGGVHTISFNAFSGTIYSFDLISSNPANSGVWAFYGDTFYIDNGSVIEKYVGGFFSSPSYDITTYDPTFTAIKKIAVHVGGFKIAVGTSNGYVLVLDVNLSPLLGTRSHRKVSPSHTDIKLLSFFDKNGDGVIYVGGTCTNIFDHKIYGYFNVDLGGDGLDAVLTMSTQRLSKAGPGGSVPAVYSLTNNRKPGASDQSTSPFVIGMDATTAIPTNSFIIPEFSVQRIPPNTFSPLRNFKFVTFTSNFFTGASFSSILLDSADFSSITDYKNNDLFFGTKNNQLYFRHTSPEDSEWILTGTIAGSLTTTSSADTILHLPLNNKLYLLDTAGKTHVVTTAPSTIAAIDEITVLTFAQTAESQTNLPAFTNIGIAQDVLCGITADKEIYKYRHQNDLWVSAGYRPNFSNHLLSVNNTHATYYP